MKPVLLLAAMAGFVLAASPTARADTLTKQIQVTAQIVPFCAVIAGNLDFGNYTSANISGGLALDGQTYVGVLCPVDIPYAIGLDGGLHGQVGPGTGGICDTGGPMVDRFMTSVNGGNLGYELYSDAGRSAVWGCAPESDVAGVGNGSSFEQYWVYGRIPAGAVTLAESYTDTITVTVTF